MGDYVRSRRRTIGLVTLAVACVITGLWVRSDFILDAPMFSWFRQKPKQEQQDQSIISQLPGVEFPWPAGAVLTALDELVLALPTAMLGDRPMSDSVFGADGMQVNLPPDGDTFYIKLMPQMSVSLAKACESYVVADDKRPRRMRVTNPPSRLGEESPIKDLIESYKDAPIGASIAVVSRCLGRAEIILPTEAVHEQGQPLKIAISLDNQGRSWMYGYTDESELLAAFPNGKPFVAMRFRDAFQMAVKDPKFGGISINHTQKYCYRIPREVFDDVQAELDKIPDSSKRTAE